MKPYTPPTGRRMPVLDRLGLGDLAVELYAEWRSTQRVADHLGVARWTVANYLKRRGVTLRPPGRPW